MVFLRKARREHPHPDEVRMTLGEHLEELRSRLIKALFALLIGAVVCYFFRRHVMAFLTWPIFTILRQVGQEADLGYLSPAENFMTFLKVSIILGMILTAPYSITQLWGFVAAGLYPHERRWVNRFAPVSIVLFFVGSSFLLVVVSPLLLRFLLTYETSIPDYGKFMPSFLIPDPEDPLDPKDMAETWPTTGPAPIPIYEKDPSDPPEGYCWINRTEREVRIRVGNDFFKVGHLQGVAKRNQLRPNIRISAYVTFILHLAAAFGIGFQVPVVVAFLAAIGITTEKQMRALRRYVWFGMAIAAAFLTPPDISSMMFLLVPMALLYEVGLFAARFLERERAEQR